MEFNIEVRGLKEFQKDIGRFPTEAKVEFQKAMIVSTSKLKGDVQGNITSKGISNTGQLRRSVSVIKAHFDKGIVGVGERYGLYVERGTRPHFPPVAPLERWAQTKLGQSGLGFVIARKIAQRGTKAQPFVEPAFRSDIDFVTKQFDNANLKLVRLLGGK